MDIVFQPEPKAILDTGSSLLLMLLGMVGIFVVMVRSIMAVV